MSHGILARLRKRLHAVKCQKHKHFDDFKPIIEHILTHYSTMFPSYRKTKDGSRVVYSFNVEGVAPISLEKEHGSRDHIPPKFAKRAICGIEEILTFIEALVPDSEEHDDAEKEREGEGDNDTEDDINEGDESV